MILDSIILNNFGAYAGKQEALLTPEEGKPIILFGGMNGGGKTTLLDGIQLAFYGPKARISNRGKLGYKEYLRESMHRGSDPGEGAGVIIRFRRMMDGEYHNFELQRTWREGVKGIEETVRVLRDGLPDDISTEHWDEAIEAYLPNGIAHLFFFDGEQIKELAEGGHAAEILGTAIHSLLGLDLVDRLETDLKVFERRKKSEGLDREETQKLIQVREELIHIDQEQEKVAMEEGALVNKTGQLAKELRAKEDLFRSEGGELYLRRQDLETELESVKGQKKELEVKFRELAAGPLPLLLVQDLLAEVENVVRHETEIRRSRILLTTLEERDREVIANLRKESLGNNAITKINNILGNDRNLRKSIANETLVLDADDSLAPHIAHLRVVVLPETGKQANNFIEDLAVLDEKITRLEGELERVPTAERIAVIQQDLNIAKKEHETKKAELDTLLARKQALQRQRIAIEMRLDKLGEQDMDIRVADDDRQRMLKHSIKVRGTLLRFRTTVVQRHATNIENLMFESFQKLLHKTELVKRISINPETFEAILTGKDGKTLPFDRLSAGERQLLATSLLWGLARASGRPVPTIIDTPLSRLDSSHRKHLIERYFPYASHQVLLLSTDEEIVGSYYSALKPYTSRTFLLSHNRETGQTDIKQGYFNETTS
jgi:DNA sulfur modification protein DndD